MATIKKILIIANGSTSSRVPNMLSGMGNLSEKGIYIHPFSKEKKQKLLDEAQKDFDFAFIEMRAFSKDGDMHEQFEKFISDNGLKTKVFNLLGSELTPDIWKDNKKIAFKDFIQKHISEYQLQD